MLDTALLLSNFAAAEQSKLALEGSEAATVRGRCRVCRQWPSAAAAVSLRTASRTQHCCTKTTKNYGWPLSP